MKFHNLIFDSLYYKIRHGANISFWEDVRLLDAALLIKFPLLFYLSLKKHAAVKDFWVANYGVWNLGLRRNSKDAEINE